MKKAVFQAFCPFEIKDKVKLVLGFGVVSPIEYVIEDILAINSVKTGKVNFQFIITNEENKHSFTVDIEDIERIID